MPRRWGAASTVLLTTLLASCGSQGGPSTAPTPVPTRSATLTFRVYNSATGELSEATFSRVVESDLWTGLLPSLSISLATLSVRGVDPVRAVLRLPHVGDQIGGLVGKTVTGTLTIQPTNDMTYELYLMNAASSVDYGCLDYTAEAMLGASTAFPTLRRVTSGQILGCPIEDGEDDAIESAVGQFNQALNPFGIKYGLIIYVGTGASSANMTIGWAPWDASAASKGGGGYAVVQKRDGQTATTRRVLVAHELAHAYLGAPDYYDQPACFSGNTTCALVACPVAEPSFSSAGQDAARYWALMDSRTRGRSAASK